MRCLNRPLVSSLRLQPPVYKVKNNGSLQLFKSKVLTVQRLFHKRRSCLNYHFRGINQCLRCCAVQYKNKINNPCANINFSQKPLTVCFRILILLQTTDLHLSVLHCGFKEFTARSLSKCLSCNDCVLRRCCKLFVVQNEIIDSYFSSCCYIIRRIYFTSRRDFYLKTPSKSCINKIFTISTVRFDCRINNESTLSVNITFICNSS